MRVAAAAFEADGSSSKPAGLALDSRELSPVVDDEIGSRIFTEWEIDLPAVRVKGESNRERRAVTDSLWVLHSASLPDAVDGPCPK
jgi:hypothetical protein